MILWDRLFFSHHLVEETFSTTSSHLSRHLIEIPLSRTISRFHCLSAFSLFSIEFSYKNQYREREMVSMLKKWMLAMLTSPLNLPFSLLEDTCDRRYDDRRHAILQAGGGPRNFPQGLFAVNCSQKSRRCFMFAQRICRNFECDFQMKSQFLKPKHPSNWKGCHAGL